MDAQLFDVTPDGSIVGPDEQVFMFSRARFERDICRGACCFVCGGAKSNSKPFNDEHVLPRWLLRRHGLFAREITLPNGRHVRYDRYKVPCCVECNTFMGREIEEPVRDLIAAGYNAVDDHLKKHGPELFFRWMSLIYIKTHLRDATYPWTADRREDVGPIGDVYDWEALHHIHCVARSLRAGVGLGHGTIGTFVALPALSQPGVGDFDYRDFYQARSVLIRSGQTAFIAVLNDSRAAWHAYGPNLRKVTAPLTSPQLAEALARFAYCNLSLRSRPRFATVATPTGFTIEAEVAQRLEFEVSQTPSFGALMYYVCSPFLEFIDDPEQREVVAAGMREGRWSYLFNGDGNFIDNSAIRGED